MATGSTGQRSRKREARAGAQHADKAEVETVGAEASAKGDAASLADNVGSSFRDDSAWMWASLAVVLAAACLRFYALELKPLHHDEGVNGFFLMRLLREGIYQYDPANYHGPVLYYFALVPIYIQEKLLRTGATTFGIRLLTASFGTATVWLVLSLRRYIGALGALSAAALIAVSPGAVFNSRYFIHETLFVFFTLGIVVAALNFYERRRPTLVALTALGVTLFVLVAPTLLYLSNNSLRPILLRLLPEGAAGAIHFALSVLFGLGLTLLIIYVVRAEDEGRPVYLLLAFVSAALLFATKETAFISVIVLALAAGVAWAITRFSSRTEGRGGEAGGGRARAQKKGARKREQREQAGGWGALRTGGAASSGAAVGGKNLLLWMLAGLALFVFLNVVFYSSFYTYAKGVEGALETFKIWTRTGMSEFHQKPFYTYLLWLLKEEAAILVLAAVGAGVAVFSRSKNRFAIFAGAWAFGLLAAYSFVPYKTPWLAINFVVPMAIAGGYAVNELYAWADSTQWRWLAVALFSTAAAAGVYTAWDNELVPAHEIFSLILFGVLACFAAAGAAYALSLSRSGAVRRQVAFAAMWVAAALGAWQAIVLNFYQYDNDRYPYVYAHTKREFIQLVGEVERLAARAGTGTETNIAVASPDYWPMPWYFRNYKHIGYFGQVNNTFTDPIVIGNQSQDAQLQKTLGANYRRIGLYPLRPGVELVLFARNDLVAQQ